jgi:hypothetical protein
METECRASIAAEPDYESAYLNLDHVFVTEKRFDDLTALWTLYLANNPGDEIRARYRRSRGHFFGGRTTEGLEDVDAACKANLPGACAQAMDFRARMTAAAPSPLPVSP